MKKKFLIVLFIAIIACLFAFSANAENEVTLVGGEKADFTTVFKVGTSKNVSNVVLGFNDGYSKNEITDVIFPDEINGIEVNGLFSEATSLNTLTFEATDTFFISGDAIFSKCSVKTITFNPDCVVELRKGTFSSCTSLTTITFPKFKALTGSAFKSCASMRATNDLIFVKGITEIGGHAFNGCSLLSSNVVFPSSLEKINEYAFNSTSIKSFDFSKCSNLTVAGGDYESPFGNNDALTSLDLSACINLTAIRPNFAQGCDNLTEVILPPNLQSIPNKAFAQCPKLQSIVIPASCQSVGVEAFMKAGNSLTVKTFTLYIQSNVVFNTTSYSVFNQSTANIEFVLFGDNVTAESFQSANASASYVSGATIVDYLDPDNMWGHTAGGALSSHTIVVNYCDSLALTKSHSKTDEICDNDDYCADCGYHTCSPHDSVPSISYPNGYDKNGQKQNCSLEICGGSKKIEINPLFEAMGYSIRENGGYGIVSTFLINKDLLKEYETVNGALTIGIIVANASFDGQSEFMSKNPEGKYVLNSLKGIQVEMSEHDFSMIDAEINRFTQNEATLNLVMSLYVIDADGISYIQHEGTYAGTVTKGDATLDIVTIAKIAEINNITLPFVVPTQSKELEENI